VPASPAADRRPPSAVCAPRALAAAGVGKMTWLVDFVGYSMRNAPSIRTSLEVLHALQVGGGARPARHSKAAGGGGRRGRSSCATQRPRSQRSL
jgi:hypothetical protein